MSSSSHLSPLTLSVSGPNISEQEVFIQKNLSIGRSSAENICIDEPEIDRVHSKVAVGPDGLMTLECVGEHATILLPDGTQTRSVALKPGSSFKIGSVTLRCRQWAPRSGPVTPTNVWMARCPLCHASMADVPKEAKPCPSCSAPLHYFRAESGFEGWLPRQVGPYAIRAFVAEGGMGIVLRGLHKQKDIPAAIKLIRSEEKNLATARFAAEVETLKSLRHPNVVRLQDYGTENLLPWLAMDWVDGEPLARLMAAHKKAGKPLPLTNIKEILRQVVAGLSYLHQKHIVHRDLKPGNILIAHDGLAKVADFGIAKANSLADRPTMTTTGTVQGTEGYIAPEVVDGRPATEASDVFAFGMIWYEMLTGQRLIGAFVPPHIERPEVPTHWSNLIARCLHGNPIVRPSIEDLANLLEKSKPPLTKLILDGAKGVHLRSRRIFQRAVKGALGKSIGEQTRVAASQLTTKLAPHLSRRRMSAIVVGFIALSLVFMGLFGRASSGLNKEFKRYQQEFRHGSSTPFFKLNAPTRYTDWLRAAESGNAIAELFVGRCYQEGIAVPRDDSLGLKWMRQSADHGNTFAMNNLGRCYDKGHGVAQDDTEAMRWYRKAAEAGESTAMGNIGILYHNGQGVPQDYGQAMSWYRKAADAGEPNAMSNIGTLYQNAQGVPQDYAQAMTWYRKAADAGYSRAMRSIGSLYANGQGVTKDSSEASKWYRKAAAAGDSYSAGLLMAQRIGPAFTSHVATDGDESTRKTTLAVAQKAIPEFKSLDLVAIDRVLMDSEIVDAVYKLRQGNQSTPILTLHDEMVSQYVRLYKQSSLDTKTEYLESFSGCTGPLVEKLFKNNQYDEVSTFWRDCYADLPIATLTEGDKQPFIAQMNQCVNSLLRAGIRKEGKQLLKDSLALCDKILTERPWDWYTKEAYTGLCFESAATIAELGDSTESQALLRRAWTVRLGQYGKEQLLDRYARLPLKGKVPEGASADDAKFFMTFAPKAPTEDNAPRVATKDSLEVKFTVPTDFSGVKYPFDIYIKRGPKGYAELQDQFRWVKEIRGGTVPTEVRDSFARLNKIAVENKTDFMELCIYALSNHETTKTGLTSTAPGGS